jgi:seryl-tRNA synthetase
LEEIRSAAQEVVDRYNRVYRILGRTVADRYEKLQRRYERHVAELREALEQEQDEIREAIENVGVELPEIPEAEVETERDGWLFDSERGFLEQTIRFRRAQGKG